MLNEKRKKYLKNFAKYTFIFTLFFLVFRYIQSSFPQLEGFDAYYHIKHSYLIRTKGLEFSTGQFPWMQFTVLKEFPADPWFGFHVFLIPFTFLGLITGAKFAAVTFTALFFTGLYWVLKRLQVKYAWIWPIILFFINGFGYRFLMCRPHLLSVLFAVLGAYFVWKKKYVLLFILSLLWGITAIEVLIIIALGVLWVVIEWFKEKRLDWKLIVIPIVGSLLGFLFRPDFPNNLILLFYSTFRVMFLRLKGVSLNFGMELAIPYRVPVKNALFLFFSSVLPVSYLIVQILNKKLKKIPKWYWFLFIITWGLGGISLLKSQRFIEYWAPFAVIFAALAFTRFLIPAFSEFKKVLLENRYYTPPFKSSRVVNIYQKIFEFFRRIISLSKKQVAKICLGGVVVLIIVYLGGNRIFEFYRDSIVLTDRYEESATWLKENTDSGDVVLNQPWSTFPFLFHYNHQNYYGWGMDPAFMYEKNKDLYWYWRNLTDKGIVCSKEECEEEIKDSQEVFRVLDQEFETDYLLIDKTHSCDKEKYENMEETLSKTDKIKEVFYEKGIKIYRVGGSSLQD